MAFSLAQRGDGLPALARISRREIPRTAVLVSIACAVVSVGLNGLLPDRLLGILLHEVGSSLVVLWVFIAVSQLRLRPRIEADGRLAVRMWAYPYLGWFTLALLGGFVALMLSDDDARGQLASTGVLVLVLLGIYVVRERVRSRVTGDAGRP